MKSFGGITQSLYKVQRKGNYSMLKNSWINIFMCSMVLISSTLARAAEIKHAPEVEAKIERIGGTFIVSSIKPLKDNLFRVTFVAKDGSPRFKTLVLESSHVHMAIAEGASLRLSADVIAISGSTAEVSQVVIFVPGRTGEIPIWMMSRRATVPNPPAKLLEMHVPQTDYQVF